MWTSARVAFSIVVVGIASFAAETTGPNAKCDASLWRHVHDVQRLEITKRCQTVTGVIATVGSSDDGDVDIQLTPDPGFELLLNDANVTKLSGNLQIEAICQAPVGDQPDARRACANFRGTVPIPAVGTHVQVTGVYVRDSNHGWMEIHPISALTATSGNQPPGPRHPVPGPY